MALSSKDKNGVAIIVAVVAVVVAGLGAKVAMQKPHAGPDGCVGAPAAQTVVVLDHSEVSTEQTVREIAARTLAHVRDKVQTGERVTVFYVSELSKKSLVPAFSRCKPPQDGNRLTESVQGVAKAYEREFLAPLTAALNAPIENAKESPVAQAVIDVSLSQYLRSKRNSLLVYSDLLEHTPPKFSLYSCVDPNSVIAKFRDARKGARERPEFHNTSVSVNIIPRTDVPRGALACRDKLWTWFFGDSSGNGAGVNIDYLPGT